MTSNGSALSRFLKRMSAFAGLQLVIAGFVLALGGPVVPDHPHNAMRRKAEMLRDRSGPRVIMIGGSNVAFGVHSTLLEEDLGLRTVNLALAAGLGIELQLACVERYGRAGDVVVVAYEYELYTTALQDGIASEVDSLIAQWPEAAGLLGRTLQERVDSDGDDTLWRAHLYVQRAVAKAKKLGQQTEPDELKRLGFNDRGDLVAHYGRPSAPKNQLGPIAEDDPSRIDRAIDRMNLFAERCRERGISVYVTFPPVPEERFASSTPVIEKVAQRLHERLTVPILFDPKDLVYPMDNFFDTGYHLIEEAGADRTHRMATALRQAMDRHEAQGIETRVSGLPPELISR